MATTVEIPVSGTVRPQHQRRCAAPLAASVALMLAVATLLIFIVVTRYPAPAATGHRTGTSVVVPHPAPGPFGS